MAIGTLLGGIVQMLVQVPSLHKLGFRLKPRIDLRDKDFQKVLKSLTPFAHRRTTAFQRRRAELDERLVAQSVLLERRHRQNHHVGARQQVGDFGRGHVRQIIPDLLLMP